MQQTGRFANKKRSGAGNGLATPDAKGLYLALRTGRRRVWSDRDRSVRKTRMDAFENSVLLSILGEGAHWPVENRQKCAGKRASHSCRHRNEELRANLLRTISHDLRTPLTSISGNASNLLSNARNAGCRNTDKDLYGYF